MILEVAILNVKPGEQEAFEAAFATAQSIISTTDGHVSHQLQQCIEVENQYVLLVEWETLADHTEGFRRSDQYQEWKASLHHFYDPFPTVHHYAPVLSGS